VGRYAGLPGWPPSFDTPTIIRGRLAKAIKWPDLTGTKRPDKPWLDGYPRVIFTCDLSDPFTESIDPEAWLTPALPVMAESPHIYLLLTKRGRRMLEYFERHPIPLNVWPGVTVTGPETLRRIVYLLRIPGASVQWASLEPLLGPVDLTDVRYQDEDCECSWDVLKGVHEILNSNSLDAVSSAALGDNVPKLAGVVTGAESGPGARRRDREWVRRLRDDCRAAQVPFFDKQDNVGGRMVPLPILDGLRNTGIPKWGAR
jgi:protein gp37